MQNESNLVEKLMSLPIFEAEWVLYLLLALSVISLVVMAERYLFYRRHRIDIEEVRSNLDKSLKRGDFEGAAQDLQKFDSLETNVVLFGLREYEGGPEAVEDLIAGAAQQEKARYEKRLNFLATVASNAPFIGLFGTVLGIIRAFQDLSGNMGEASGSVMAGIAEALVTTAVGLLVAIPAVVAFNVFKAKVKVLSNNMNLLARTLTARLKAGEVVGG